MRHPIRVLLVSDHRLLRDCLGRVLAEEEGIEVAGTASGSEEVVEAVRSLELDLVILDANLSFADSHLLLGLLMKELPEVKVLVLGLDDDGEAALASIEAGAASYVSMNEKLQTLVENVRSVARGEAAPSAKLLCSAARRLTQLAELENARRRLEALPLTHRELGILRLISEGLSNRDIADRLCISTHTVKNHVHHILSKLEVRHRLEAVLLAQRKRWLEPLV